MNVDDWSKVKIVKLTYLQPFFWFYLFVEVWYMQFEPIFEVNAVSVELMCAVELCYLRSIISVWYTDEKTRSVSDRLDYFNFIWNPFTARRRYTARNGWKAVRVGRRTPWHGWKCHVRRTRRSRKWPRNGKQNFWVNTKHCGLCVRCSSSITIQNI